VNTAKEKKALFFENPYAGIWDILSISSITFCLGLFLIQWQQLPFFLDMYYHLGVAKGFETAGGVVTHNFWEYGPTGMVHLYPPLLHLLMLLFLKVKISGTIILKLLSVIGPVLLLFSIWYTLRRILTKRVAFFAVFLSLSASIFMISISFTPAATLGAILLLFGIYFIHTKRINTSIFLFGSLFYTHAGMAAVAIIFVLLSAFTRLIKVKEAGKILLFMFLIGGAWILHMALNIGQVYWHNTAEMPLRFYPILLIFFIIGLIAALRNIKEYKIILLLLISLIPLGIFYTFRLLCAQGMVGIIALAAIGIDRSYDLCCRYLASGENLKKYRPFFLLILLGYLLFFSPSIFFYKKDINFKISDSLPTSLYEGKERGLEQPLSLSIYSKPFLKSLAKPVEDYSDRGEFIWSNYRYIAGMLWPYTKRPTLTHMLLELSYKKHTLNIHNAALLIIIDEPTGTFNSIYRRLKGHFKIVGNEKNEGTNIYFLANQNRHFISKFNIPKIAVKAELAYLLLLLYIYAAIKTRGVR